MATFPANKRFSGVGYLISCQLKPYSETKIFWSTVIFLAAMMPTAKYIIETESIQERFEVDSMPSF